MVSEKFANIQTDRQRSYQYYNIDVQTYINRLEGEQSISANSLGGEELRLHMAWVWDGMQAACLPACKPLLATLGLAYFLVSVLVRLWYKKYSMRDVSLNADPENGAWINFPWNNIYYKRLCVRFTSLSKITNKNKIFLFFLFLNFCFQFFFKLQNCTPKLITVCIFSFT